MKKELNKTKLIIENKKHNLNEIDFILFCGKVRIYKSNGTIQTIAGNFKKEEYQKLFLDIACAVSSINKNFLFCQPNKLVNLNNIQAVKEEGNDFIILTHGFDLRLNNLAEEEINLLCNKVEENKQTIL